MPVLIAFVAVVLSLVLMVWSADRFVDGAVVAARHYGMAPLLVGMVVVGFGTSAPEMAVSVLAAMQGSPDIALGNAYGSNITNIALILGLSALIFPVTVPVQAVRKELPILLAVTFFTFWLVLDGGLGRFEGMALLLIFGLLMAWTALVALRSRSTVLLTAEPVADPARMTVRAALTWLVVGLVLLVVSSQVLVWGAVKIAVGFGVGELLVGLTIVAIGTSLPELASSIVAARKKEHDIALGNILGSNLFNTLVVVGLAAIIQPMTVTAEVMTRDLPVMAGLTLALLVLGFGFRQAGSIGRVKGAFLVLCYCGYTLYLVTTSIPAGLSDT